MRCLNCDEAIVFDDQLDNNEPFQCEHCDQWMVIELDEGSYEGAIKQNVIMLDENNLEDYS